MNIHIYNPLPYMSIPFVFLWKVLRESDTKRGRIATSIVCLILIIGGLYLLFAWNKVPTEKHFVSLERLYTKEASDSSFFVADYYLKPVTGGFYDDAFNYRESVDFDWNLFSKGHTYPRASGKEFVSCIQDIVSGEMSPKLQAICDKNNMSFDDFDYAFLLTHLYDIENLGIGKDYSTTYFVDTIIDNEHIRSLSMIEAAPQVDGEEVLNPEHFGNNVARDLKYTQYGRRFTGMLFTNKKITYPIGRSAFSPMGFGFLNKIHKLFTLHDITKTNYLISFYQSGIDSANYTIRFKEGVAFSEMNIMPTKKDMNSITFGVTNDKRYSYMNIKFYVEFLESNNIQSIRIGLLMALLALPLGLMMRNIWFLLTQTTSESHPAKNNTIQSKEDTAEAEKEAKT